MQEWLSLWWLIPRLILISTDDEKDDIKKKKKKKKHLKIQIKTTTRGQVVDWYAMKIAFCTVVFLFFLIKRGPCECEYNMYYIEVVCTL